MKKQFSVACAVALVAMGTLGSGCKQLTPDGMANVATQDLGIPVFLWALNGDVCADRQLKALFDEFARNSNRAGLSARFKTTYKAVVVLATRNLGDLTGELKMVQLQDGHHNVVDSKTLIDTRTNTAGHQVGTDIDKGDATSVEGKVLSLRPNRSEDKSTKSLYVTTDARSFAALGATDSASALTIEDAIRGGTVSLSPQGFSDTDPCGKMAKMEDLF